MKVKISDYPQLQSIAWSIDKNSELEESLILALYERNWKYVDQNSLTFEETTFISKLVNQYGNGVLNV